MKEFRSRRLRVWENINRTMQEFKVLLLGYRSYTALLTQTGTDAPVATVLENTLGNIVWTYDAVGSYVGTLIGGFPYDKIFIPTPSAFSYLDVNGAGYIAQITSLDTIIINSYDGGGSSNGILNFSPIEIRVYN